MAKKRKTANPNGSHHHHKSQNGTGNGNDPRTTMSKKKNQFESFPLSLLSNQRFLHGTFMNDDDDDHTRRRTTIQELHPHVWVMPNFFSPRECRDWVDFCERSGGLEYTAHPATKCVAHRECFRMQQLDGHTLAQRIYERLGEQWTSTSTSTSTSTTDRNSSSSSSNSDPSSFSSCSILARIHHETADLYHTSGYQPVACNPNLRVYKYTQGHAFGKHVDGNSIVADVGRTEVTVLIYLTDDCQGGATRFYPHRGSSSSSSSNNTKKNRKQPPRQHPTSFAFAPQVGSILLHVHGDHCLEHEADPVVDGIKYVLRTDLVFAER